MTHPVRQAREEGDYEELVLLEGPEFDAALVGVWLDDDGNVRAVYRWKALASILEVGGMSEEGADEWVAYNIDGLRLSASSGQGRIHPVIVREW